MKRKWRKGWVREALSQKNPYISGRDVYQIDPQCAKRCFVSKSASDAGNKPCLSWNCQPCVGLDEKFCWVYWWFTMWFRRLLSLQCDLPCSLVIYNVMDLFLFPGIWWFIFESRRLPSRERSSISPREKEPNHWLKSAFTKGICDRSQEGNHQLVGAYRDGYRLFRLLL